MSSQSLSGLSVSPLRVLLVEDDDDHAELILRCFSRANYPSIVDRVDDGFKAVAYLQGETPYCDRVLPDLVLLDINLPIFNGHEVLERVRSNPELQSLSIVILSTSREESDVRRASDANVTDYLVKPQQFDGFCSLIEKLVHDWRASNVPNRSQLSDTSDDGGGGA
ncbi:MAG: response regulator [Pirellulaceae bacterium]|nr:response regulator [Pirellulaceae bacterium]